MIAPDGISILFWTALFPTLLNNQSARQGFSTPRWSSDQGRLTKFSAGEGGFSVHGMGGKRTFSAAFCRRTSTREAYWASFWKISRHTPRSRFQKWPILHDYVQNIQVMKR
ncbi:MAG: hypothetical protein P4L42_02795 [Desulfocapsaceae bacterium]|nr:hypothetical protein [Desulfocapsaceae bacterium]